MVLQARAERKPFADRAAAGRELAVAVQALKLHGPVVVVALPRGGVPVAVEVARVLAAPLDLLLVRKIGAPGQPELALAAVAESRAGAVATHLAVRSRSLAATGASLEYLQRERRVQEREIERRRIAYLGARARPALHGAQVVLVDDGMATGATARAAIQALRAAGAAHIVLAVPVAPAQVVAELMPLVQHCVCLWQPEPFHAVGLHYKDFAQVDDREVTRLLDATAPAAAPA